MVIVRCDICHDTLSFEKFQFFRCGHGMCNSCIANTHNDPLCAVCRTPKVGLLEEPRHVYPYFEEAPLEDRIKHLTDTLNYIQEDSPSTVVETCGRKIRGITECFDQSTLHITELLDVAKNLDERLSPLHTNLKRTKHENYSLLTRIDELTSALRRTESLSEEIVRLERNSREERKKLKMMKSTLEKAVAHTKRKEEENANLRAQCGLQQTTIQIRDKELAGLQASVQARDNEIRLLKTKIRGIRKTKVKPIPAQNPDDSLLVEPPPPDAPSNNAALRQALQQRRQALNNIQPKRIKLAQKES
ncbi:hypothetical protein BDQ12DRAFT_739277 [Crucibulum laeve]|uniref:RING-type domain-containing protein n=1 Tax=Crucibulum laeve TaxID=68775 RepID=A0A5C3LL14_9AGAR|nr:hypothetical protein BDQ12DRAFT_739277 [Crucibulum laeve]